MRFGLGIIGGAGGGGCDVLTGKQGGNGIDEGIGGKGGGGKIGFGAIGGGGIGGGCEYGGGGIVKAAI